MWTLEQPSTAPAVIAGAKLGDLVRCTDGVFVVVGTSGTGHVSLQIAHDPERDKAARAARAVALLESTDFVVIKSAEGVALSDAWLSWREELRRVVRGERSDIPPEPSRYGDTPPAPVSDQPSTQEQASAPPSVTTLPEETTDGGAAPAYAGTMLQEDRENYLRGVITVRVTQIEQNRLQGRYDANARERQRVGFVEFHNASDLGLPITDEVRAAYDEFLAADQWVRATKDHADALRSAAITVGLDLLEAMQTSVEEGWP